MDGALVSWGWSSEALALALALALLRTSPCLSFLSGVYYKFDTLV